jgi:hypothetical protein
MDTLQDEWTAFDQRAEELGHKLIRDEDGDIDHFVCDAGYHNGPGCSVCHVSWCHHSDGAEDIQPCDGGAAHEADERQELACLRAKYKPAREEPSA